MKTLWLIRHAKSSWQLNTLPDFERPLNERGYRDAHEMSQRVLTGMAKPTCILVSPAVRTYTTAIIVLRHLRLSPTLLTLRQQLYESGVEEYLSVLRSIDDTHSHVMLFGHNPVITELVNLLSKNSIENVPTCGILRLRLTVNTWKELGSGRCELISFDFPKKFGDALSQLDA